jgi:LMBR1 domain-containing protein 1
VGPAIAYALKWIFPVWIAIAVIILSLWYTGYATAKVDATLYYSQLIQINTTDGSIPFDWFQRGDLCQTSINASDEYVIIPSHTVFPCTSASASNFFSISWIIFTLAIVLFLGWLLFAIFCGVGFVAVPFDLIQEFQHRPKPITAAE